MAAVGMEITQIPDDTGFETPTPLPVPAPARKQGEGSPGSADGATGASTASGDA